MGAVTASTGTRSLVEGPHVHRNLSTPQLVEAAIARGEASLAANGALVALTGARTGRSPRDKFIVRDGITRDAVDWGKVNQPFDPDKFQALLDRVVAHMRERDLYVLDLFAGADENYRLPVQIIAEYAWHALFVKQLFRRPLFKELASHKPEFIIIAAPEFEAVPERDGTKSSTFIITDFSRKLILIGGTKYAGEMKKSIFGVMNFLLPERDVLPMHCSANVGASGDTALFFGLSGTGKTTLSADPQRRLIGDDEHGWSPTGIFNIEGGCYAKCIDLSIEKEPQIFHAIRFGAVLENVVIDPRQESPTTVTSVTPKTLGPPIRWSLSPMRSFPERAGTPKTAFSRRRCLRRAAPDRQSLTLSRQCTISSPGIRPSWREPKPAWAVNPCRSSPLALPRPFSRARLAYMQACWANGFAAQLAMLAGQYRLDRRGLRNRQAHELEIYPRHGRCRAGWLPFAMWSSSPSLPSA